MWHETMWSYKWETAGTFYTSCIAPVQAVIIYRRAWTALSTVTKTGVYLHSAVRGLTCFCSHSKLKICLREAAGAVQRLQVCKLKPGSTNSVKKENYTSEIDQIKCLFIEKPKGKMCLVQIVCMWTKMTSLVQYITLYLFNRITLKIYL